MNEIITCSNCQKKLQLPEEYLGKTVQCPSCKTTFTAQRGGSAPAPPERSAPEAPSAPPLEEEEPRRHRRRRDYDDYDDDYDDDDDDRPRRIRRDLVPHRAGTILTLGILSLVLLVPCVLPGGFLGIFAWVMGNNDLAEIRAGRMDPSGEGSTQAGRICGMIAVVLMAVGLVLICLITIITALGAGGRRF